MVRDVWIFLLVVVHVGDATAPQLLLSHDALSCLLRDGSLVKRPESTRGCGNVAVTKKKVTSRSSVHKKFGGTMASTLVEWNDSELVRKMNGSLILILLYW